MLHVSNRVVVSKKSNSGRDELGTSAVCVITKRQITCRAGHIHYMLKELRLPRLSLCLALWNMHDHEESATGSLLNGCETWSVTLWVQASLKVFETRY